MFFFHLCVYCFHTKHHKETPCKRTVVDSNKVNLLEYCSYLSTVFEYLYFTWVLFLGDTFTFTPLHSKDKYSLYIETFLWVWIAVSSFLYVVSCLCKAHCDLYLRKVLYKQIWVTYWHELFNKLMFCMNTACCSLTSHWVEGNELVLIISIDKYGACSLLSGLWSTCLIRVYLHLNHFLKLIFIHWSTSYLVLYALHLKFDSSVCFSGLFSCCM